MEHTISFRGEFECDEQPGSVCETTVHDVYNFFYDKECPLCFMMDNSGGLALTSVYVSRIYVSDIHDFDLKIKNIEQWIIKLRDFSKPRDCVLNGIVDYIIPDELNHIYNYGRIEITDNRISFYKCKREYIFSNEETIVY